MDRVERRVTASHVVEGDPESLLSVIFTTFFRCITYFVSSVSMTSKTILSWSNPAWSIVSIVERRQKTGA